VSEPEKVNPDQSGGADQHTARFVERVEAVAAFAEVAERLIVVGDLEWADAEADWRTLAVNVCLRRQQEQLRAAVLLARQSLGHLAVGYVRTSLEDLLFLGYLATLSREDSRELLDAMGRWDHIRSLLAQRDYLGDEEMKNLWYPAEFLNAAQAERGRVEERLKDLRKKHRWSGGLLPSAPWAAEQAGRSEFCEYLYAATSRSVHFSMGEVMRRSWGDPGGRVTTSHPQFNEHLASFALDQLWRLFMDTAEVAMNLIQGGMEGSGIGPDDSLDYEAIEPVLDRLLALGKVPLVHAHEWNLGPDGPY
jgi:hypothetical protein